MERVVSATEARVRFGEMIRRVAEEEEAIIVEKSGEPRVVIVSLNRYKQLKQGYTTDWEVVMAKIQEVASKIQMRRGNKPFTPSEEIIREMREERNEQLFHNLP